MLNFLIRFLSTFFFIGYLPFIPGTFGSLAAVAFFMLLYELGFSMLPATLFIIVIGLFVCGKCEFLAGRSDPPFIVIDEVSGMFLSLLFLPYDYRILFLAFILFRILDTLKPYPANCFEKFKGGLGIMGDDIVAGLYVNIILQLVVRFSSRIFL